MKIENLQQLGFKVRVTHGRYFRNNKEFHFSNNFPVSWRFDLKPRPHGGCTVVELTDTDGNKVAGYSQCNKIDRFNKKVGVDIALSRALLSYYENLDKFAEVTDGE